jgi:hypothetical protein
MSSALLFIIGEHTKLFNPALFAAFLAFAISACEHGTKNAHPVSTLSIPDNPTTTSSSVNNHAMTAAPTDIWRALLDRRTLAETSRLCSA